MHFQRVFGRQMGCCSVELPGLDPCHACVMHDTRCVPSSDPNPAEHTFARAPEMYYNGRTPQEEGG